MSIQIIIKAPTILHLHAREHEGLSFPAGVSEIGAATVANETVASVADVATRGRFERVFHKMRRQVDGSFVTIDEHAATIDHETGLMWCVDSLGVEDKPEKQLPSQQACVERCTNLRLLGFDDWCLAERRQALTIVDDTRCDPAVDPEFFPRIRPAFHWLATAFVRYRETYAWGVDLDGGHVGWGSRDGGGFALAVRRAGQ